MNVSPLDTYAYPREVKWEIDQNNRQDYIELAKNINEDDTICGVIIQHEYGIFGGLDGKKILHFMRQCKKPMLVTLHTALPKPTASMREVTEQIINYASNVVVLTKSSKEVIEKLYPNAGGKIFIIPHGIHETEFSQQKRFKEKLELDGKIVLSTFGLLSRGKGIEYAIQALPAVIKKYPTLIYLVLGETHPVIRRNEGEKYRLELARLVKTLGLENNVKFYDQYLSLPDLLDFLRATDIYISTSTNPNQAVSGTLSYALGAGRAVVSTDFAQAKEIVTHDIGRLVPIKDPRALTEALLELLGNKNALAQMAQKAYESTRVMLWSYVAQKYTNLLIRTIVPPLNLKHLIKMTDDFGMLQFSKYSTPDKESGYTLDDNARAMIVCSWLTYIQTTPKLKTLIQTYLHYVKVSQKADGSFVNYIDYHKRTPTTQNEAEDLQDTQARTLWALSTVIANKKLGNKIHTEAMDMYLRAFNRNVPIHHLRAQAFAIKSYALLIPYAPKLSERLRAAMKECAENLLRAADTNSDHSWRWFEKDLNYSNALLSESLLIAGVCLDAKPYITLGLSTLNFLIQKTFSADMYLPIGHEHWYKNRETRSRYDQQPEDPASTILALEQAYKITQNEEYKNLIKKCFSWFLGNNSINKPVYDEKTGGCCDGLHPDRVNENQGAESLLSYLMSYCVVKNHM